MKKHFKVENIFDILFDTALQFLLAITFTCLLTTLGFLVKIPITSGHLIISYIISCIIFYFFKRKEYSKFRLMIIYLIPIFVILVSICICNLFWDISYDGVWYHLRCIIRLKDGWNPIYNLINTGNWGDMFMDAYPCKASWMFGANVYALTNNLRTTNILNIILMFVNFCVCSNFFIKLFKKYKFKIIISVVLSFVISFNAVFICQLFTNYLDANLGFLVITYFFIFAGNYLSLWDIHSKENRLIIILLIAIMMNMKLTGLFFAAAFYGLFYLLDYKKLFKNKKYLQKAFFTGLIGVVLGLIIGINPYITNIVRGHNPFYPIIGKGSIEVMGDNVPGTIRGKYNFEKLLIDNLSITSDSVSPKDYYFKNPLKVYESERKSLFHDTRVGGFGPYFPLTIYISVGALILILILLFKKRLSVYQIKLLVLIGLILIVALIFGESWWARYYVILWTIPVFLASILLLNKNILYKFLSIIILAVMSLNIYICFDSVIQRHKLYSTPIMKYIDNIQQEKIEFITKKNFVFAYNEYFKTKNINAKLVDSENGKWDFEGYNIKIRLEK